MARVAETIPELWLNRQGFLTMRGLKTWKGHGELDLVVYHPHKCVGVHVEVSASPQPSGFLGGETAARIRKGVDAYVRKKYRRENVKTVREATCPAETSWRCVLAHGELKREEEVRKALRDNDVEPVSLFDMLTELLSGDFTMLNGEQGDLSYRVDTDAAYFTYLAHAYAKRTGREPKEQG